MQQPGNLTSVVASAFALALASGAVAAPAADTGAIHWIADYTGEAAANVSGGLRQGQDYAGQLVVGADFDLARGLGLDGVTVHLAVTNRHGRNLAQDYIGGSTSVQEAYGAENTRLARLTVEQSLFNGRLTIEAGRTVANASFLDSALCQAFQTNSACGTPTFAPRTSGFTMWPVSSWGGHAQAWLTPKIYAHAGAYEVNPDLGRNSDHGLDWRTSSAGGVVAPYAVGYKTTFANDAMPRLYEAGGWYDNADYNDPLHDATGGFAAVSGKPYAIRNGRSGAFVRFEQMVLRPDPSSERGLTVFGVAMTRTSGRPIEDRFLEVGFVQRGVFPGRDQDTVGFVINQQSYSGEALTNLRLARAAAGGVGTPPSSQVMMELSYGLQFGPSVRVQPNLQYIVKPDQFDQPARLHDAPNAFVLGLRLDANLADLVRNPHTMDIQR